MSDTASSNITLAFDGTTLAWGRNKGFVLHHGRIVVGDFSYKGLPPITWVDLSSKREGDSAPISLTFSQPRDLRQLAQALSAAAAAMETLQPTIPTVQEAPHA